MHYCHIRPFALSSIINISGLRKILLPFEISRSAQNRFEDETKNLSQHISHMQFSVIIAQNPWIFLSGERYCQISEIVQKLYFRKKCARKFQISSEAYNHFHLIPVICISIKRMSYYRYGLSNCFHKNGHKRLYLQLLFLKKIHSDTREIV